MNKEHPGRDTRTGDNGVSRPAGLPSLSPGRVNGPDSIPCWQARLARASAVPSSLRPAPAAGADAGEWGPGRAQSEAETAGPLAYRGLTGASSRSASRGRGTRARARPGRRSWRSPGLGPTAPSGSPRPTDVRPAAPGPPARQVAAQALRTG